MFFGAMDPGSKYKDSPWLSKSLLKTSTSSMIVRESLTSVCIGSEIRFYMLPYRIFYILGHSWSMKSVEQHRSIFALVFTKVNSL